MKRGSRGKGFEGDYHIKSLRPTESYCLPHSGSLFGHRNEDSPSLSSNTAQKAVSHDGCDVEYQAVQLALSDEMWVVSKWHAPFESYLPSRFKSRWHLRVANLSDVSDPLSFSVCARATTYS